VCTLKNARCYFYIGFVQFIMNIIRGNVNFEIVCFIYNIKYK